MRAAVMDKHIKLAEQRYFSKPAPKLTRRHFIFIAEVIQELDISAKQRNKLAVAFACKLMRTNNAFKFNKFVEYATAKQELV